MTGNKLHVPDTRTRSARVDASTAYEVEVTIIGVAQLKVSIESCSRFVRVTFYEYAFKVMPLYYLMGLQSLAN